MSNESVERSIPESQDKTTDEDAGELTPYQKTAQLSQQFADVDRRTVGENKVLGDVVGIYSTKTGGSIAIEISLPAEEGTEKFIKPRPKVWSDMYEFVRFVEKYDYGSGNFEAMIRDEVQVEVERDESGDDYELVIPASRTKQAKSWVAERVDTLRSISMEIDEWGLVVGILALDIIGPTLAAYLFSTSMAITWDPSKFPSDAVATTPLGNAIVAGLIACFIMIAAQFLLVLATE